MATSIVMPQMGYDMQEGTVVRWIKKEGEDVARGEVIAEIETDKAIVEFEAYTGGVLRKIVVDEGIAIPVGTLIAVITDPDEALPADMDTAAPAAEASSEAESAPVAEAHPAAEPAPAPAAAEGGVRASPIARRLGREQGVDLSLVTGTGPGGRIVEADVLAFAASMTAGAAAATAPVAAPEAAPPPASAPAPETAAAVAPEPAPAPQPSAPETPASAAGPEGREELSRMRQAIARVTVDSKREAPHFYVSSDIDMGRAMAFRRDINDEVDADHRVSVNDLIIKASAIAIGLHPKFNAFFRDDHLEMHASVNIGIAIALESGLIVPGINGCEGKSLVEIAAASRDLGARARSGTLRNDEYSGTTFSISNLGMFDVDSFTAIIFPPHAAVLAVGTVKEQPVVRGGEIAVGQIMNATLSVDHRVADGAEAAEFLVEIKKLLESPLKLVL